MTLLLNNEEVDRALTHEDALSATEAMLAEPPTGQAINRPRSETYIPVILPLATGNRWCGLVMLFDLERLGTITLTSRLDDTYTARVIRTSIRETWQRRRRTATPARARI